MSGKCKKDPEPDTFERDLLEEAIERFAVIQTHESEWRRKAVKELNFVDGLDHWDTAQKDERKGRPCLVVEKIGPSIDQVPGFGHGARPKIIRRTIARRGSRLRPRWSHWVK